MTKEELFEVYSKHVDGVLDYAAGRASEAFGRGFIEGLRAFAHWKDGVQYVGTCGTTLREAEEMFSKQQRAEAGTKESAQTAGDDDSALP